MHFHFLLPLLAGLLYTVATLFAKRAITLGGGAMRIAFFSNLLAVPFSIPLLFLDNQPIDLTYLHWPVICGVINFVGMAITFATIRIGDISVQTPVMGSKILIVAALVTILYSTPIPIAWWIAAFLAVVAIALLGKSKPKNLEESVVVKTIILALSASAAFAVGDVLMSQKAPLLSESLFIVLMLTVTSICSFFFIPFFKGSFLNPPPGVWHWMLWGSFIMALEEIILYAAIAFYGSPTAMNILYSSRAIWSIILVWTIGHWFKNTEKHLGKDILTHRLIGAVLLFAAIVIVLATEPKSEQEELCDTICISMEP